MIDFIKAEVENPQIAKIMNNRTLSFKCKVDRQTGVIDEDKYVASFNGLTFTVVNNSRLFVQGSLPKFLYGNNYQNLSFQDYLMVMNKLRMLFNLRPCNIKLQNVEYGVSLEVKNLDIHQFLAHTIIDYKTTPKEIETYNGKGYTLKFPLENYVVKLYDKAKQCKLESNMLKYEIRVKRMKHLKSYNIVTLEDLFNPKAWFLLKESLLNTFNNILVCGSFAYDSFSDREKLLYQTYSNQNYWLKFKPTKTLNVTDIKSFRRSYYGKRKEFKTFIEKFNLDYDKKYLINLINDIINSLI